MIRRRHSNKPINKSSNKQSIHANILRFFACLAVNLKKAMTENEKHKSFQQ